MANRGLSAGAIAELGAKAVEMYSLLRIDFSTPVYYTTAPYDILYNDGDGTQRYSSLGVLLRIPTITESLKIKPETLTISLSGAVAAVFPLLLLENKNAPVYVSKYLVGVAEGVLLFKGFTDSYGTVENAQKGTATVSLRVANHWSNWEAKHGVFLSDAEQQRLYSGDLGLEYANITDYFLGYFGNPSPFSVYVTDQMFAADYVPPPNPYGAYSFNGAIYSNAEFQNQLADSTDLPSTYRLPIVYGEAPVSGVPVFRTVTDALADSMWVVYALAEGECDSLIDILFDGISYTDARFANHVYPYFHGGHADQTADALLASQSALWTTAHRLRGICYVAIKYYFDPDVFTAGQEPSPVFHLKGKRLYDPRTATTVYSKNNALVLYDYLTSYRYGKGITDGEIAEIIAGANYCDLLVTDNTGGSAQQIKLFEFHGILSTTVSVKKNVEAILFSMRAHLPWISGKYTLVIEREDDASIFSIDENFITDNFSVKEAGVSSLANVMFYSVLDEDEGYAQLDVVAESATYLAADGRELKKTIKNKFEVNRYRAQNRVNTELKRTRQTVVVEMTCGNSEAIKLETGNIVDITRATQGWTGKEFRVIGMKLLNDGTAFLNLHEYEPSVYDWDIGVEITPPANTTVPSPFYILPPTDIVTTSGTATLFVKDDGTIVSRIKIEWTRTASFYIDGYNIYLRSPTDTGDVFNHYVKGSDAVETYIDNVEDGVYYTVGVSAVSGIGAESAAAYGYETVVGKTEAPSDVTGFTSEISNDRILLSWAEIADLDKDQYEIREGASWDSSELLTRTKTLSYLHLHNVAGAHVFWIKAIDTTGNYSDNATTVTETIVGANPPTMSHAYDGQNIVLSWTEAAAGSYPIDHYEVNDGSGIIAEIKNLNFTLFVSWLNKSFTVAAVDVNGIKGATGGTTSNITAPSVANLTVEIIDNNVLLRWGHSLGTLPIKVYEIRKGAVFATADVLQEVNGTFATFFEVEADDYIYWVVGVDTAGNYGTEQSVVAKVSAPPDYVLNVNWSSVFDGTKVNAIAIDGEMFANVNLTETWQTHFSANGWTSFQSAITAGFDYFLEKTLTTGSYEETFDYLGNLPATLISVVLNSTDVDGSAAITPNIQISSDDISYTDLGDVWAAYGTNFRYVKVKLDFVSAANDDVLQIDALNVILNSKIKNDMGTGTVAVAGTGEAVVWSSGVEFVDIASIIVTPAHNASYGVVAVYDFTDVVNPTGFDVYLYRADNGAAVTGDFSWSVRGY